MHETMRLKPGRKLPTFLRNLIRLYSTCKKKPSKQAVHYHELSVPSYQNKRCHIAIFWEQLMKLMFSNVPK